MGTANKQKRLVPNVNRTVIMQLITIKIFINAIPFEPRAVFFEAL